MAGQPEHGSNPWFTFDVSNMTIKESGTGLILPHLVIPRNKSFSLSANFDFAGFLSSWLMEMPIKWKLTFYYESFGPGPEGILGTKEGQTLAGVVDYNDGIDVPGGISQPGTYKLTCTFTTHDPSPLAGFIEGPMIQIT